MIGYLEDKWPFLAEDRLAAAAHGLDVFKKKYRDDWQWLLEANAHPDAAADTIVRTIEKESARLFRQASYNYERWPSWNARGAAQLTPEEQKGIASIEKERKVIKDGGRNPCVSPVPGIPGKVEILFYKPNARNPRENRQYSWTGSSLKMQADDPMSFTSARDAEAEIRRAVLTEVRRYHPGDDVYILGW